MRRRDFVGLIGAAALPLPAIGQSGSMPVVGFLNAPSPDTSSFNAAPLRQGLKEVGFVEGRNLRIEERWANGDYQILPALAADLVAKGVVAIAATGDVASALGAE